MTSWNSMVPVSRPEVALARRLYESVGFASCEPFDRHTRNRYSTCMSMGSEA